MKQFFKEIIIDPLSGKNLVEEKIDNKIVLRSEEKYYHFLEDIPILLPKFEIPPKSNSAFHSNFNSTFDYANHYKEDALQFDYFKEEESKATREEIRRLHQSIIKKIPSNAEIILDVGCGKGWVAKHFLNRGKKVVSMDISPTNPTKVLKENPHENHAALVADAFYLPIRENSIDTIIASEIIEHVYDPKIFIRKLLEALKPGGKLIITTPYNEKIEYFLCVHCNKPTPKNAHLHSFNEKNFAYFIPRKTMYKTESFSNKYIVRSRINLLTAILPFRIWKIVDGFVNSIFKKPLRFLIEITKS